MAYDFGGIPDEEIENLSDGELDAYLAEADAAQRPAQPQTAAQPAESPDFLSRLSDKDLDAFISGEEAIASGRQMDGREFNAYRIAKKRADYAAQGIDPDEGMKAEREGRERLIETRQAQENLMRAQLQYVIDNTKDDNSQDGVMHRDAQKRLDRLNNLDMTRFDDDTLNRSMSNVAALHKAVADRRGHASVFADALKRGYTGTAIMSAQAWLGITGGDDPENVASMRRLQSAGEELDAANPKKTGGVSEIGGVGDVVDFIAESIGENAYRMAIGTAAAIASGGAAGLAGAGSAGATAAAMAGSSVSTLALNTGEAVQDQIEEGVPFSRGWALAQGTGYSVLDGAFGVEAGLGKLAVSTGLRAAKDTAVEGLKNVGKMATRKGALATFLKGIAGEAIQEPAQSQLIGRGRRWAQTGSPLREGETAGQAWMEALDEAAGGAAAALGVGGGGAAISHANARRIVGIHNRVVDAVKKDETFKELSPENQLLVARRLMNDSLLETDGVIDAGVREDLVEMNKAIDAELGRDDADADARAANAILRGYDLSFAKEDFATTVENAKAQGMKPRVDWAAMRDSATKATVNVGGADERGTLYMDPVTKQQIFRREDGNGRIKDFVVVNNSGLKDSLTGDALHTKSLDKALAACGDLDVYNQYRAKKSAAKRQVIAEMFDRMYGNRGAQLVIADSLSSVKDRAVRDKFARYGAKAAYDAESNRVYVLADQIKNIGQLYTDLAHERAHLDIAEHILGKSGGAETGEERGRLEAGREKIFGGESGGAERGEERIAEAASVEDILRALRDTNLSLPGSILEGIRRRIAGDTGYALQSISDEDARTELRFLVERGFLGKEAQGRLDAEHDTDAERIVERFTTDFYGYRRDEEQRIAAERAATEERARGKAGRKAAGEEAARVIAEDGRGDESVPPITAAQEERLNRGADMDAAMGEAEEQMGRMREKAAARREEEESEKARIARDNEERAGRVRERKADVEAALSDAGGEIADMAERRRVVRERAEGVAQKNLREAEERNAAERDEEEAAALAEEEKYRPAREAIARREEEEYNQRMLEREEARGNRKTTRQEKPNETGNGADEAPAQPEQGTAGQPQAREAARPVEAEPPRAEAQNAGVVAPQIAGNRAEAAQKPAGARPAAETGEDTPATAEGTEAASRASDATGAKPAESGNAVSAISADDFVAAHSTADAKGRRVADKDIGSHGEIAPPADYAAKKTKPVKPGDATAALKAVGRNASQDDDIRPALKRVHVEGGQMVATDGRRIVVAPAPGGVADGDYDAKGSPIEPTESEARPYPDSWRQVIPDVNRRGYRKIGEIANGDAAHGRIAFTNETAGKVRRAKGGVSAVELRVGNAGVNPQFAKEVVDTMFALGAERIEVFQSPDYAPVVFKGRNAKGEITGVMMPLRANDKEQTHVKLFSDGANAAQTAPAAREADGSRGRARLEAAWKEWADEAPPSWVDSLDDAEADELARAVEAASEEWERTGDAHGPAVAEYDRLVAAKGKKAKANPSAAKPSAQSDSAPVADEELAARLPEELRKDATFRRIPLSDRADLRIGAGSEVFLGGEPTGIYAFDDGTFSVYGQPGKFRTFDAARKMSDSRRVAFADGERIAYRDGEGRLVSGQALNRADGSLAIRVKERVVRSAQNPDGERVREVEVPAERRGEVRRVGMRFKRSSVTPEEDAAYMDAVERGDMETAQRMAREAAAKAMPDTKIIGSDGNPIVGYHFTKSKDGFTVFDREKSGPGMFGKAFYFFPSKEMAENWGNFDGEKRNVIGAYLDVKKPWVDSLAGYDDNTGFDKAHLRKPTDAEYAALVGKLKENGYEINPNYSYDGMTPYKYTSGKPTPVNHGLAFLSNALVHKSDRGGFGWKHAEPVRKALEELGYDGVVGELDGYTQIAVFEPNQIKSADAVTRDDAGNVIPLSQRFNPQREDIRFKVGGIYTGTAADYANRSRQGGVDDGPSLLKIGTGEGSQVYGWGLYGSTVRGVAERYAKTNGLEITRNDEIVKPWNDRIARLIQSHFTDRNPVQFALEHAKKAGYPQKDIERLERGDYKVIASHSNLYEQTFFTDRAPGDESHLLKWYEPVSEEQLGWIRAQAEKEGIPVYEYGKGKTGKNILGKSIGLKVDGTGENIYEAVREGFEWENGKDAPRLASEFLARAGIDGVKYPVDSYGGKGVKDGDEAGWNYVSFRDDNIRVDHKWTDGQMRYKLSAPVDDPDVLFGARESRKAHGLDDLTAEESGLAYTDKELYAAGQRIAKDVPHMMNVVNDALTSDRALPLEDTFALTVFLRDKINALADLHAKMQNGNAASFKAEEEYLSAVVEKVSKAVARNNTKLAGLRVARLGVMLDTARDTEAWITQEVRTRRAEQGLPAEPSEADNAMIKRMAEQLKKANDENEALRKQIEDLQRDRGLERTAAAAVETSRREAKSRTLSPERRSKAAKYLGTELDDEGSALFANLDNILGSKGIAFKSGGEVADGTRLAALAPTFAALAKKYGYDNAERAVLAQHPEIKEEWTQFRRQNEKKSAAEIAKLALPVTDQRLVTTKDLAEAREETKRLLDGNTVDPREKRIALGHYLRRYRDALINENPDIPMDELNRKMAAEATALTGTEHDAVAMLAVSAGVDGYDLETRAEIQRKIAKSQHALDLFRQGKTNEAARESGILYEDEATALKSMEDTLLQIMKEKQDEIDYLATFSEKNAEAVERVKRLKEDLKDANSALSLMRKNVSLAERKAKYAEVLEKRIAEARQAVDALRGETGSEGFRERKARAEAKVSELKAALAVAKRDEHALNKIKDKIAEYEKRIADGEYDRAIQHYRANDAELQAKLRLARERRNDLRKRLDAERRKRNYREMGVVGKTIHGLFGILGEMKSVVASFDLSSVLRQGGQLTWAHPFLAAKNLKETLKAWNSEDYADNLMAQLRMRPNWRYYEKAGIDFTDWGEDAQNKEDMFLLNQYRKITNAKLLKKGVMASERAFSMFLNLMRADVFDAMANGSTFGSAANMNDSQLKALGRFINIATQRGAFEKGGKFANAIPWLNVVLWSPRNVASRFQFLFETARLAGGGAAYGDKTLRSLFAKELVRYIGGMSAAAMFLKAVAELFRDDDDPPNDMEFDPRSSDFLKVRFGNIRMDLTSGLTPIIVLGARTFSRETKNLRGQLRKTDWEASIGRFGRQKLAPGWGLVYDLFKGEDFEKHDIDWGSVWEKDAEHISAYRYILGSFVPLTGADLLEQAEQGGLPKTFVTGAMSILGANVQAFDPYNYKQLKGDYTYFKGLYDKAIDPEERRHILEYHPMLKRRERIEAVLKQVRNLENIKKKAEKNGQSRPDLDARIKEAKERAIGVMAGLD